MVRLSHSKTGVIVNVDDATASGLGPEWGDVVDDEAIGDADVELVGEPVSSEEGDSLESAVVENADGSAVETGEDGIPVLAEVPDADAADAPTEPTSKPLSQPAASKPTRNRK